MNTQQTENRKTGIIVTIKSTFDDKIMVQVPVSKNEYQKILDILKLEDEI